MIPEFLTAQSTPITQEECKNVLQSILTELQLEAGPIYQDILRYFVLEELDRAWKDHLKSMDYLREGIGLRGYGQRDPKLEYKREGKTQENSGQKTTLEAKNNPVHAQDKIGRNDPCPCGSGKKYKKCHGAHLEH